MHKHLLLFLFLLLSVNCFAGKISGVVIDSVSGTPLTGVIVNIKLTDKGTATDVDGKFEFDGITDGRHELVFNYISYKRISQKVVVKGNEPVSLNIKMTTEGNELGTATVVANKITRSENAVILELRKANSIVTGIGAAQIGKTMDRNAADVVKRVPGVTINDDRFIIVRGLYDRYNTVWLNDAGAPSSETDKKSFSFDLIPSGLIDRVLVYKTPAPELPGDFAGGMVKIYTTSIPDKNSITVGFQTSYRDMSTGSKFNYNQPSSTDWLGYDKGIRNLPKNTPDTVNRANPGNDALTKAFGNDWKYKTKTLSPDIRFSLAVSNVINREKVRIGNTFGLSYSSVSTNVVINKKDYDDTVKPAYDYNDLESKTKVTAALMDNIAIAFGNSKIEFKNLYNQTGKSTFIFRQDAPDTLVIRSPSQSYLMGYESLATYTSQLSGTHKSSNEKTKYNWTLGYTDLFKNQPDLRRIKYNKAGSDTVFKAAISPGVDPVNGGGRFYSGLYEHTYSFNHQINQSVNFFNKYVFEVTAGNFIEYKSRTFYARNLGYVINPGPYTQILTHLPVDQIFADSNVGSEKKFRTDEIIDKANVYSGSNQLIASYISLTLPIGKKLKIVGGVRDENNIQSLHSFVNNEPVDPKVKTDFLLPSVNVSYNFTEENLVRVAYGKTLNRPEFREWSPFYFYDFERLFGTSGSLFPNVINEHGAILKVAEIQNYDARWEFYPNPGELLHVGVFYKSFKNPIQEVIVIPGADSKKTSFINAPKAYCQGIEIDARKKLDFIDSKLNTNVFKYLTFVGNLTLSKSELTIDTVVAKNSLPKSPLQGQSPYVINTSLYYQNADQGLQASLLYNVYGPRVYVIGEPGEPSIIEMPFHSLDISIAKEFGKHIVINFGVQNLLNSKMQFIQDSDYNDVYDTKKDKTIKSYKPGSYFSLGVKVKF